jgi:hypothetical protein
MKPKTRTSITRGLLFVALILFLPTLLNAQGTLYVSSIQSMGRFGGMDVGNDAWIAEQIESGNNSSGYVLNSVELAIGGAGPEAGGLSLSVYSDVNNLPSTDLGNLTGPSDPTGGFYTYSASGLMLSPSTEYFIVAIAATSSFEWVEGNSSSVTGTDQWTIGGGNLVSANQGLTWTSFDSGFDMQMAIYATPVPEPPPWILGTLGGGIALCIRVCAKRRKLAGK